MTEENKTALTPTANNSGNVSLPPLNKYLPVFYNDMNIDQARATIRRLEADSTTLGTIILYRRTDPRWQQLQEAYKVAKGVWF